MQLNLFVDTVFPDVLEALFEAYYDCRRRKRNTINALAFERNLERELFDLHEELICGQYRPGRSIAFLVHKPVMREIFATDFRDRVVHHLLINKLNPLFEKLFIQDSYACRVGKGTLYGIKRVDESIQQLSKGYTRDCFVLKMDISAFFMSIDRQALHRRLQAFVMQHYAGGDKMLLLYLLHVIVNNDPTKNCIIRGKGRDWELLPGSKSLFTTRKGCGLPIGNLTSQIFANFYLHPFDVWMQQHFPDGFYGRYVDDFVVVHPDKQWLKDSIPGIRSYLMNEHSLTLHPRKLYLQEVKRGLPFLGAFVKPHRVLPGKRIKGNFVEALHKHNNNYVLYGPSEDVKEAYRACVNSYLGYMAQYVSFNLRKRLYTRFSDVRWRNWFKTHKSYKKINPRLKVNKTFSQGFFTPTPPPSSGG